MITIKPDPNKKPAEPEITFTEVFEQIVEAVEKLNGQISHDREHAVESQLRACIRHLGYRPREGKTKLTISELAAQAKQAIDLRNGDAPEGKHEIVSSYVLAVHSNVLAELGDGGKIAREVPELPAAPLPPSAKENQPTTTTNKGNNAK